MTRDARCLTPKEYARERKVSLRTVQRLIKAGKIPAERVGCQWRIWVSSRQRTTTTPDSSSL
jgi:excisionase family DNA binding protein